MKQDKPLVIVTGSSGFIGQALIERLAPKFALVGFDRETPPHPPAEAECVCIDLTDDRSVEEAFKRVRTAYGERIASVIHLAAYFDLTGEPNPKYEQVTVQGTGRLLRALQAFKVEQFVFASSMLAHKAGRPGEPINEDRPLQSDLPYRVSKIEAERLIHEKRGSIPTVYLRPAGVYDDMCRNPFLANQIARVYERDPRSHVYPGDLRTGQSFLHLDDLTEAVFRLMERRKELPSELPLLLGEPEAIGYGDLQSEIARLIHGEDWETRQVPKALAKAGVWIGEDVLGEEAFIRPWMIDIADDHYDIEITRARTLLGWAPKHSLREALSRIIGALKGDPVSWYKANKLNAARIAGEEVERKQEEEARANGHRQHQMMHQHFEGMRKMHFDMLWVHYLNMLLGLWLATRQRGQIESRAEL